MKIKEAKCNKRCPLCCNDEGDLPIEFYEERAIQEFKNSKEFADILETQRFEGIKFTTEEFEKKIDKFDFSYPLNIDSKNLKENFKQFFKDNNYPEEEISLCSRCNCMTHTIVGRIYINECGKCGGNKEKENDKDEVKER